MLKIRHVQQESPTGCVVACVAMVTGRSYAAVRAAVGQDALSLREMRKLLVHYGILTEMSADMTAWADDLYIAIAPSLNIEGSTHAIVLDLRARGEDIILDPNQGRPGVKVYDRNNLGSWLGLYRIVYVRSFGSPCPIEMEDLLRARDLVLRLDMPLSSTKLTVSH